MKRAYAISGYAKPCERYCRTHYPDEAEQICKKAESKYLELMKDLPDLGKNIMAKNMLDWFTIVAFYEASGRRLNGETLLAIKRQDAERLSLLGRLVNGNRQKWPYRLFKRIYVRYNKQHEKHLTRGEWTDSWRVEIDPGKTEGFAFRLIGCPIAKHAKAHGYTDLLPYLCKIDHFLAEVMHARLIRTQTEALGGSCCDYWYVGDQSPVLEKYKGLPPI